MLSLRPHPTYTRPLCAWPCGTLARPRRGRLSARVGRGRAGRTEAGRGRGSTLVRCAHTALCLSACSVQSAETPELRKLVCV
eukprot:5204645-Prymnesium_polylepis.1